MELLIGCGTDRKKKVTIEGMPKEWSGELVTLDIDETLNPDVVHDLNFCPYPFDDDMFDEIHAYDVLEHCGRQGDWRFFFDQFYEFWRILKPGGLFVGLVPAWDEVWAWGDPGHTRVIPKEMLSYLFQESYEQVGNTAMTDYRFYWKGDFEPVALREDHGVLGFVLRAKK